jgi:magnesium-protoporphyrin IX monomethyl ester (oxidative) cyclase
MYVRDHTRPALHVAMGIDPTEYDYKVLGITTEITRQVFPISLNTDNPAFRSGLERLFRISKLVDRAKAQVGAMGKLKQVVWSLAGLVTFARLYFMPVNRHTLPQQVRMVPAW